MDSADRLRYSEYREQVERDLLPSAVRNAILIFVLLQTLVFIPADWVLHREHFGLFLSARMLLNAALLIIYFGTATRWPSLSSVLICGLGTLLFLSMVEQTGGVKSGYYVGMILLVIGMGVLSPQSAKNSALIAAMMFGSYLALPLYSSQSFHAGIFVENLFFLAAACVVACWACSHMDRMRFADYKQKRELERARDELAQLDRAKSRFSSNIHHELRTPLTLILAPLDAVRGGDFGPIPESVQDVLSTMHTNGQRLYKMINNLLDLAKLESDQFGLLRRPTRLVDLVTELVSGAKPLAERKQVDLSMQGFTHLPEVNVDPDAIDKVLVNLVGNALKFTSAGDQIVISAEPQEGGIEVCVADSGVGIPSEKLGSIFDRFAQVDGSATRRHEGTGIGLALALEMVELHGGAIVAESAGLGMGTTFRVFLPHGDADPMPDEMVLADDGGGELGLGEGVQALSAELNLDQPTPEGRLGDLERTVERWRDSQAPEGTEQTATRPAECERAEVLIADDNPDMRALLAKLVGAEFRVRVARTGLEALDALRERPPDLLLSDIMMPEMSGTELCSVVKQDPLTRAIPVVLVTSKAEREMKIEGLELGADDYVTKPFHPRELMARVRSLIRVVELQKQLSARNGELESALVDLKQAEVQLVQSERLAAVGEMAAGIAHEVNNPVNFALNAVRAMQVTVAELRELSTNEIEADLPDPKADPGRLETFQHKGDGEDSRQLAETLSELSSIVSEGLQRTAALVGDLREFARPGSRRQMCGGVDLEAGLVSTIKLSSHAAEARDAKIELRVESGFPKIFADASALNQVFLNLIKNAVECFEKKGGRILIDLGVRGDQVVVEVADDGPGIQPETLDLLFDPFFTTKESKGGTGLGLSIGRRIVDAHGGRIEVESEEGRGTCFRVILPVGRSADIEEGRRGQENCLSEKRL